MKILKVSKATAYEIMERPDFPLIRIGRNKRVIANDFQAWLINNIKKENKQI